MFQSSNTYTFIRFIDNNMTFIRRLSTCQTPSFTLFHSTTLSLGYRRCYSIHRSSFIRYVGITDNHSVSRTNNTAYPTRLHLAGNGVGARNIDTHTRCSLLFSLLAQERLLSSHLSPPIPSLSSTVRAACLFQLSQHQGSTVLIFAIYSCRSDIGNRCKCTSDVMRTEYYN